MPWGLFWQGQYFLTAKDPHTPGFVMTVVSARQDAPSLDLEGELVSVDDLNNLVKAALIKSEHNSEEKWLYCQSKAKAAVASAMKIRSRLNRLLSKPQRRLNTKTRRL